MADASGSAQTRGDLLIELGCEELPPKSLDILRESLFSGFTEGLRSNNFAFDADASRAFSTPRRLALLIGDVAGAQPDRRCCG